MFNLIKEIKSKAGELHFQRYDVISWPWLRIYIHNIAERDKDLHPHSHPWHFVSFALKGEYIEEWQSEDGSKKKTTVHNFPHVMFRKAQDFHKIVYTSKPSVWTLVIAFGKKKPWGLKVGNQVIGNEEYRILKQQGQL